MISAQVRGSHTSTVVLDRDNPRELLIGDFRGLGGLYGVRIQYHSRTHYLSSESHGGVVLERLVR